MYRHLKVSNAGNLICRTYDVTTSRYREEVIFDTAGLGDRRARKAAARAELAAQTKVYAEIVWHATSPAVLHRVGPMRFTITL